MGEFDRRCVGGNEFELPSLFLRHVDVAGAAVGLILFMPKTYMNRFLAIPWDSSGRDSLPPTRTNQIDYYQDMLTNWLIVGSDGRAVGRAGGVGVVGAGPARRAAGLAGLTGLTRLARGAGQRRARAAHAA